MNIMQEKVLEFMKPSGYPCPKRPVLLSTFLSKTFVLPNGMQITMKDYLQSRMKWMKEELGETKDALYKEDLLEMIDGLVDLTYFVLGTAVSLGIDLEPFFLIIHENNMSKYHVCDQCKGTGKHAKYRKEDGKLVKMDDWIAPAGVLLEELGRQIEGD